MMAAEPPMIDLGRRNDDALASVSFSLAACSSKTIPLLSLEVEAMAPLDDRIRAMEVERCSDVDREGGRERLAFAVAALVVSGSREDLKSSPVGAAEYVFMEGKGAEKRLAHCSLLFKSCREARDLSLCLLLQNLE